MAGFSGIAAAGRSIIRLLDACFQEEEPVPGRRTRALLIQTNELTNPQDLIPTPALTIFFYRVDFNRTMRAAWSAVGSQDGRAHLPVDLHFLITPWADNAEHALLILGKAMECLETTPILSGVLLDPSATWLANESVQLLLGEITTEEVMRTFDSLPTDYRLSVPYVARIVRLDARRSRPTPPVTTLVAAETASAQP